MVHKTKTSVSISSSLLRELAEFNQVGNVSEFIEKALSHYIKALKKQERAKRDLEIINANAERFNKEAEENLLYQAPL
jgi:metal-responsive CopG/Arc/MetJ family transcriptional regulator